MQLLRTVAAQGALDTPPERDRILDVLRAFAILGVVGGHVIMAMTHWDGNRPSLGNVLASSSLLQLITWLLQVMPLFFIAGGAASYLSWNSAQRKSMQYSEWLWKRMTRLLSPVFFYLAIMAPLGGIVSRVVDEDMATPLLNLTTQLLWFLGVYLLVTALTPVLATLHRAIGVYQALGWFAVVITADVTRLQFDGPDAVGLINFVAVWAIAASCGIWYLEYSPSRLSLMLLVIGGFAINAALVFYGPYPVSLVGMPNESFSNMAPPSLVMAIQTVVMWAGVELLKPTLKKLSNNARVWRSAISINLSAMTIYLWHLPTLIVWTVIAHQMNWTPEHHIVDGVLMPTTQYWSQAIPLWCATWISVYALVQVLWFTEHISWPFFKLKTQVDKRVWRSPVSVAGVIATGVGMLLISGSGLSGFPTKVTEFAGLSWTGGFAVAVVLGGTILVKVSTALVRSADRTQ